VGGQPARLSGGLPVNLASVQSAPQQVALDPLNAYWTNGGGTTPGSVLEVPLAGGPAITLATGQTDAVGIAAAPVQGAGTYVFWVNRAAGQLMAAPAIGGFPPIELASGLGRPERVAVGTDSLYWTDNSSGNVMELACAREGEPRDAGGGEPSDGALDAEPTDSSLDDATIEDEANDIPGIFTPPPPPNPNQFFMLCPVDAGAPLCNDLQPTCNGAPVIQFQPGEAGSPPPSNWSGGPVVPGRYDLVLEVFYPTTDDCKSPVSLVAATAEVTATSATSGSIQIAETTQTTGTYGRVTSDTVTESYTTSGTTITETVSCGPTQSGPMTGIYQASSNQLVIQDSVTLVGADGGPCSVYEARIYSMSADDAGTPDAATPVDAEVAGNAE
jgi:hypothetical protein